MQTSKNSRRLLLIYNKWRRFMRGRVDLCAIESRPRILRALPHLASDKRWEFTFSSSRSTEGVADRTFRDSTSPFPLHSHDAKNHRVLKGSSVHCCSPFRSDLTDKYEKKRRQSRGRTDEEISQDGGDKGNRKRGKRRSLNGMMSRRHRYRGATSKI